VSVDGAFETRDSLAHVAKSERVVKLVERRMEKAAGVVR